MVLDQPCLKSHFILKCTYVYVYVCVCTREHGCMHMGGKVSQSTEGGFTTLELELKVMVENFWTRLLESELRTSARAIHTFNHRAMSPAPQRF